MSKKFLSRALTDILITVATTIVVDAASDGFRKAMFEHSRKNKNPIGFVQNN